MKKKEGGKAGGIRPERPGKLSSQASRDVSSVDRKSNAGCGEFLFPFRNLDNINRNGGFPDNLAGC